MSSERETFLIGDLGRVVTGKTPSTSKSSFYEGDIPFYTPSDMDGRRFLDQTKRSLSELGASTVGTSVIDAGSVMVSCIGSVGKVAIAPKSGITNQQINTISTHEWVDPLYLYYELKTRKAELQALATSGSVQPILNKGHFCEIEVEIPTFSKQKAIAHVLGTLDDKIELNRKTIETLEGIAKALFKSWFVDFDPVRAKADGRSTGLPDEISELFPDSLEESELGEIPTGWSYKKISEWGSTICGKTPPTKDESLYGGDHLFVTIPDLHEGPFISHASKTLSNAGAESQFKKRLPAGSVMVSCIATPGLVGITQVECFTNQQINSIIPFDKGSENFLLFSIIESKGLLLSLGGGGSVFFNLSKGRFDDMEIISPSKPCVAAFGESVAPLIAKCFALKEESRTLSTLRDALLPRLISGELRVPDAENLRRVEHGI